MIILNKEQEEIKNKALDWFFNKSEQVFEIAGCAGTGKSVLMYAILSELGLNENQYMPMAYTGQASIVMRTKGFKNAKSIHSSLYILDEYIDWEDINKYTNTPKKKKIFRRKSRSEIPNSVILFFIDEAYMVPKDMKKNILSFGIKTIVCGDPNQLPPVSGEPGFLTGQNVHRLTQLMRQEADDPIVYLSQRAMKGLPIHSGLYGNNVLVCTESEFQDSMIGFADCICCGTNSTRDNMNKYIRKILGYSNYQLPIRGERVICRNNNWELETASGISLCNGITGTIISVPEMTDKGDIFNIDFMIDLDNSCFHNLDINLEYFLADTKKRKEMKDLFTNNIHYNHLRGNFIEYAYALTTHLCQGSEYNNGIYIEEPYMPNNIMRQLNYTGITRFKNKLIYIKKDRKSYHFPYTN